MKVCFITSECAPFVKTGGLADVSGALPEALAAKGIEVKVFLPLYDTIDKNKFGIRKLHGIPPVFAEIADEKINFDIYFLKKDENIEYYFVDCPRYFCRGIVYTFDKDENERFILFQHAVLKSLQFIQWGPDVFHCNDWQASYIPALLKLQYSWDSLFKMSKSLLTIHNIGYQGVFKPDTVIKAGFGESCFVLGGPFEFNGNANFLKTGIFYSDVISTVSPRYAEEITTPEYGSGLDGVLKARNEKISGILNGIDTNEWNPSTDKLIFKNYSYKNPVDKKFNKEELLRRIGFDADIQIPLFGIVTRLAWQKGIELIIELFGDTKTENYRLVVLGSGEKKYEKQLTSLAKANPDKIKVIVGYNDELAHLITAGADFFFMPSRYEPCGLNQMYSLNYGTVPVVREVGGLADTVKDIVSETDGNGISFRNFDIEEFEEAFRRSCKLYEDKELMNKIIRHGMQTDFSWERSAGEYVDLYNKMMNK